MKNISALAGSLFWKIFIRIRWFLGLSRKQEAEIGARTPDFRLQDLSGRSFTLSDSFPKKAVVLWLTNLCSSCEERIPLLERIYQASRDRLEIFAISTLGEDRATPERILRTHQMTFPLLLDPGDWVGTVLGLPHPVGACPLYNLLVLDTAGVIRFKSHLSAIGDEALLDALHVTALSDPGGITMTQSGSHDVINFKELAARYDAWYETPLGSLAHALEQEAIFRLAETKPGERTIDIGCGTGIYTLALARRGAHVVGVDPSWEMISIAREKFRRVGLPGLFVLGSAEALPFRPGSFDLALAVTSLCFVRSPDQSIKETHRVLKPEGRLVLGELNRFSPWALWRRLKGLFTDTIYNQAHFWGKRELERLLRRRGFCVGAARMLLYFPPWNQRAVLKTYRLFETVGKKALPGTGAFIAIKAEKEREGKE
ncbi:MAG: methyltransferase domain-containing protein [Candidatus Manganitrophaceae bacterium]|nr:MAG: methyltransferase domain-containing protein [Candidatus Manganitrophaceae bacterium]